jgi:intracellular sulfur oxidation DsrE/DsrF family protein
MNRLFLLLTLFFTGHLASASSFEKILAMDTAPPGVVIEIVSNDEELLRSLLPQVRINIEKLRGRFPELPIAIVSHGTEQFMMMSDKAEEEQGTHRIVESLTKSDNVEFHVCGTHASWFDVMPEDFPDYVNVTPAGPTQIANYEELDYELIVLP